MPVAVKTWTRAAGHIEVFDLPYPKTRKERPVRSFLSSFGIVQLSEAVLDRTANLHVVRIDFVLRHALGLVRPIEELKTEVQLR